MGRNRFPCAGQARRVAFQGVSIISGRPFSFLAVSYPQTLKPQVLQTNRQVIPEKKWKKETSISFGPTSLRIGNDNSERVSLPGGAGDEAFLSSYGGVSRSLRKRHGERLYRGTLNVNVGKPIPVREHFRIRGTEINEPEQDLLFEVCRINQIWLYRIRPFHLVTGEGGHGDHILEIGCSHKIPNVLPGTEVEIALFPRE